MEPFSIDVGLMVWTLITFTCLLLLLARFTFKPLRKLMEEREQSIRSSLDEAGRARKEAERLLARNEERLSQSREEARRIINEGHKIVAQMKREAEERSREEADQVVTQARADIEREVQRSLTELKGTVANLSMRIARQVIKAELDEAEHQKLADDFVARLKKSHAKRG